MLISNRSAIFTDPILTMLAGDKKTKEIQPGVYEIGHFGGTSFLEDYEHYPEFGSEEGENDYRGPYGVCDSIEQLLAKYPELEAEDREFVVTLSPIRKAEQYPQGGWRWHKWGEYIGTQQPTCEYIFDEPTIELVYVYHIYERVQDER